MTFFESASLIGSQVLPNWMVDGNWENLAPSFAVIFLATIRIICVSSIWKGTLKTPPFKDYKMSFYSYTLGGKNCMVFISFALFHSIETVMVLKPFSNSSLPIPRNSYIV